MKLPPPAQPFHEETSAPPGRLRIAHSFDPGLGKTLHPENRKALEATIALLHDLGHHLIEVSLPVQAEMFVSCYATLIAAEVAATLRMAPTLVGHRASRRDVELNTWVLAKLGEAQSGGEVASALQQLQTFSRQWLAWSAPFDVLLTPTVGVPPLPIGAFALPKLQRRALAVITALPGRVLLGQRDKVIEAFAPVFEASPYTMMANVTGQPSISLPLHWTADGLPMGMMFTAAIGDEATLYRLAGQLEQARPWAERLAPHAIA